MPRARPRRVSPCRPTRQPRNRAQPPRKHAPEYAVAISDDKLLPVQIYPELRSSCSVVVALEALAWHDMVSALAPVLLNKQGSMGANMENILKAANQEIFQDKRVLEINPETQEVVSTFGEFRSLVYNVLLWC